MTRNRQKTDSNPYTTGLIASGGIPDTWIIPDRHESITDVNNGRRKPKGGYPNSSCTHMRASVDRLSQESRNTRLPRYPMISAVGISDLTRIPRVQEAIESHYDSLVKKITKEVNKVSTEFSSLNFFYELRELPELFYKNGRWRQPEEYRYIDYAFGVAPLISDLKNALQQYQKVATDSKNLREKFVDRPISGKRVAVIMQPDEPAWRSNEYSFEGVTRVKSLLTGTISLDVPILAGVNPNLYMVLDALAVDPSASNAWEAIPFSWLVDWFLPVGDWLSSLPTAMRPNAYFVGTISHEANCIGSWKTRSSGPSPHFAPDLPLGTSTSRYYHRRAFGGSPINQLIRWRLDKISSPSQVAILRDILFPVGSKKNFLKPSAPKGPIRRQPTI